MSSAVFALIAMALLVLLPAAALRALPWYVAVPFGATAGALIAALLGLAAVSLSLPAYLLIALASVAVALGIYALRRSSMLAKWDFSARNENLAGRVLGVALLLGAASVLLVYLWANAYRPPILADTLFKWSGPARGLGPIAGFPLRFSSLYYKLADTDVAWKFLWAAMSLLPFAALGALTYARERRLLVSAGAVFAAFMAFSVLFWASSGQPDIFLAGGLMLVWWSVLGRYAHGHLLLWPPLFILAWSGPLWGAFASLALIHGAASAHAPKWARATMGIAAAGLLGRWAMNAPLELSIVDDIALFFARGAWNTARYGPLWYLTVALLLRDAGRSRHSWSGVAAILGSFTILVLELASRGAPDLTVLVHVDGSRLFSALSLLAWYLSLETRPLPYVPAQQEKLSLHPVRPA